MFDISFWELVVIALIALLVIGPDRLPGVARTAGMWMGRLRRFVSTVKADIDRELRTEELRRALEKNKELSEIKSIMNSTRDSLEQELDTDYQVKALDDKPAAPASKASAAPATDEAGERKAASRDEPETHEDQSPRG